MYGEMFLPFLNRGEIKMDARKIALLIAVVLLGSSLVAVAAMHEDDQKEADKPAWSSDKSSDVGKANDLGMDKGKIGQQDRLMSDTDQSRKQLSEQLKQQKQELKTSEQKLDQAVNKLNTATTDDAKVAALTDAVKAINDQHKAMQKILNTHSQIVAMSMDPQGRQQSDGCPLMKELRSDIGEEKKSDWKSDVGEKKTDWRSDIGEKKDDLKSDAEKKADDLKSDTDKKTDWDYGD
jgi:Spy/CpxP family protein refolding chaperone